MKPFKVSRTTSKLELTRSKKSEFIGLTLSGAFLVGLILSVDNTDLSSTTSFNDLISRVTEKPGLIFLGVFSSLLCYQIFSSLKFILVGENYTFDVATQKAYKNKKEIFSFAAIKMVQIRVYSGDTDSYDLSIISNDNKSIKLADFNDLSFVKELAGNIADVTGKQVIIRE